LSAGYTISHTALACKRSYFLPLRCQSHRPASIKTKPYEPMLLHKNIIFQKFVHLQYSLFVVALHWHFGTCLDVYFQGIKIAYRLLY